jgi:acyl carrier protein
VADFDRHDTYNKVITIIAEKLAIDPASITPRATLQELGADSLDMVEIIMKIEELFSIEINDEEIEKCQNLQDVVDYVSTLRMQK